MQKLLPALQRMLLPAETVLYIARAESPLTVLEQLTAGWWTQLLAASAIVLTNKRILFFPVKRNGSWKESVRSLFWGDLQEVKHNGLLVRNVTFKSKDGKKLRPRIFDVLMPGKLPPSQLRCFRQRLGK